jgi:hypothetical protein
VSGPAAERIVLLLLSLLLLAPAAWHIAALAQIFASRMTFPMDIEWMEGGMLLHAHRLLHGEPVYGPPSQGFLPYPYPPGYFAATAALGGAFGLDYWTGRAVSIAAFALASGVLFRETLRAAGKNRGEGVLLGSISVASAACSYPAVDGWYDLCRNDTLVIALVVLGAAMLSEDRPSRRRIFAASAVLTAAVFTKQTAIFFIAWLGLFLLLRRYTKAIVFVLSTGALSCATLAVIQLSTGGLFWIYTFKNLSQHPLDGAQALDGMIHMLAFAPFLPLMPLLSLAVWRLGWLRPRTALWLGMLAAAFPAALVSYAKAGGYLNNLIPIAILVGPTFVLLMGDIIKGMSGSGATRAAARTLTLALSSAFLLLRRYDTEPFMPSQAMWNQAAELNAFVASLRGGVLIPSYPFLAIRNGHTTPQFHSVAYWDALAGRMQGPDLSGFLDRAGAQWVILSGVEDQTILGWIYQRYSFDAIVPANVTPMVGLRSAPRTLLKRRRPVNKQNVRVLFNFEQGIAGWRLTGDAFEMGVRGEPGARRLSSYHPRRRDTPVGTATSPAFIVDRTHLSLRVGGGKRKHTRIELQIDEQARLLTSGIGSDILIEVIWDLRSVQGREAKLVIIDDDGGPWGHIAIGHVELFDEVALEP